MIDEPKGIHYFTQMTRIGPIQAPLEVCDIDCLICTVRRDSRSVLLRFLHFVGRPQDQYFENKVLLPISWSSELNCLTVVSLNTMGTCRKLFTYCFMETMSVL